MTLLPHSLHKLRDYVVKQHRRSLRQNKEKYRRQSLARYASEADPLQTLSDLRVVLHTTMPGGRIMTATDMNQKVVLKLLSTVYERNLNMAENEVRIMSSLSHANVVQFHRFYMSGSDAWIEMEYCNGGTLMDLAKSNVNLNEVHLAVIVREILKGLRYLHDEKFILHCDVKSSNILLTSNGEIKIGDFGLSKQLKSATDRRRRYAGSLYWSAPEQLDVTPSYGTRADIWAAGIVLLELANRTLPHFGLDSTTVITNIRDGPAPELIRRDKWSSDFADFIGHMLQKNEEERWNADVLLGHPFITSKQHVNSAECISQLLTNVHKRM